MSTGTTNAIQCLSARPAAKLRLVLFPYAGAGAFVFRAWGPLLPDWIEPWVIEYPGRGTRRREPPARRIDALVSALADLPALVERPVAFFGHSMGALVSFELTRELRRRGLTGPRALIVSGAPAPQLLEPGPFRMDLTDPELVALLRMLGGTPPELLANARLLELSLPLLRADFEIRCTYVFQPAPALDVPLVVCGGDDDPDASRAQLEAWSSHAGASFEVVTFPGDHFYVNAQRDALLAVIEERLRCIQV